MEGHVLLGSALLLGLRHAVDPDHVAAVSALAAEERHLRPAAWLGVVWGTGHLLSIAAVGLALFWFRLSLPPRFDEVTEVAIGTLMVVLGGVSLWRLIRGHVRVAAQGCPRGDSARPHRSARRRRMGERARRQWITFGFGLVHGLGGSGAVAVLALQVSPNLGVAMLWLFLFGLGSILGMLALTMLVAAPSRLPVSRPFVLQAGIRFAAGLASLGVGGYMVGSGLLGVWA